MARQKTMPLPVGGLEAVPAAVLYARVSSKEQEQGYSILAQQTLLRSYGTELGTLIEQEVLDVETAKTTGSPWICGYGFVPQETPWMPGAAGRKDRPRVSE